MISLSPRLIKIAEYIEDMEDIADIGTDHGYLPLYLLEKNPDRKAIFTDVNEGPLSKAKAIIQREYPDAELSAYDIRIGDGLAPLGSAEVDTVVIAGMGGILISDILASDVDKGRSYRKLILQPRTASDKLRKWLYENKFYIFDEELAYENGRICEIIVIDTGSKKANHEFKDDLDFEFSPIIVNKGNSIVKDWIDRLLETERKIEKSIIIAGSQHTHERLVEVVRRIEKLNKIKSNLQKE